MPIALFVGVPLVALCYLSVNVAFFIVLSYDEILNAEAVALVSWFVKQTLYTTCKPIGCQSYHNVNFVRLLAFWGCHTG